MEGADAEGLELFEYRTDVLCAVLPKSHPIKDRKLAFATLLDQDFVGLESSTVISQIMLAQALIATGNGKYADEAVHLLRLALIKEPEAAGAYSQLAMAYGRKGDLAHADLASAEAAFYRGSRAS